MDLPGWDERYRTTHIQSEPTPLLMATAARMRPGKALDLACGAGANALWLAGRGWEVTAVDGSAVALEILRRQAPASLRIRHADLEQGAFRIEPAAWDLIVICRYLQRDLFEPAKRGLKPGGILLAIVNLVEPGCEPTHTRAAPGELASFFQNCEILHYRESSFAEIVARNGSLQECQIP
jgi:SAM-dependent methyltransferase